MIRPLDAGDRLAQVPDAEIEALWNDAQAIDRLMLALKEDFGWIDTQLSDRDRTGADGLRLTDEEYWAWRSRAVAAKRHKTNLYLRLKARRTELFQAERAAQSAARKEREAAAGDEDHLRQAYLDALSSVRHLKRLLNERGDPA